MEQLIETYKVVKNEFTAIIEDKVYYIYQTSILNGTGYTFSIYTSSKMKHYRKNCYQIDFDKRIIIFGNKYNYILTKKKDSFEYDLTEYSKDILKEDIEVKDRYNIVTIYLNGDKLISYYK